MAYLNNIIIYSNIEEEHEEHIKQVLRKLHKENIPVVIKKCEFYTKKTDFVRFVIKLRQISMDLKKVEAIVEWRNLESVIGLRLFLGFYNYYKRFIIKWSKETEPFIRIIKKDKLWRWDNKKIKLFEKIKKKFIEELILKIYQLTLFMKVKINTSDFALGACLLQKHDKVQYSVVYYSRKMTPPELNYDIYNKELLGIIAVLKE